MKMKNYIFLVFCFVVFVGCKQGDTSQANSSSTTSVSSTFELPTVELASYPESFLKDKGLAEWEEFSKLHESMERLKELNFKDVEADLIALSARLNKILLADLPPTLEVPQIRSRFKVVQMQVLKSRYFTQHYKADSLIPSIVLVYDYYNALLSRMNTLDEGEGEVELDTLELKNRFYSSL
ncbi:MAG: hypothetical protein O2953_01760 [Bacteroidetes bacterium]|nr:hypothetical protein [Bacteroidota bacterium]MDA0922398.1 hypothetical protein [Bacteroidota bacterium]